MSASPRPWALNENVYDGDIGIDDADGGLVAVRVDPEDIDLIVMAVNAHDILVHALLRSRLILSGLGLEKIVKIIDAALTTAGVE